MSPAEWDAALAEGVHWKACYPIVEAQARALLVRRHTEGMSTSDLVEHLYPVVLARGPGVLTRRRLFRALMSLAVHGLGDCATRGPEVRKRFGGMQRPWIWHEPGQFNEEAQRNARKPPTTCPHCGGHLTV